MNAPAMINELKPYPAYKESGSRWIGCVPSNWEIRSLRNIIDKRTERNRVDLPLLSVAREKGVFKRSLTDPTENHNVIPLDLSNYKVAYQGDLVINKMKAWQGSMGIAPCDGIVSPAYYVYKLSVANSRYAEKLFRSKPYVAHFGQASDGVRVGQWDLSISGMRNIPVVIPPPEEQAAIVRFLDHANRKIDRFIRGKKKLIALLNEQKQAIIHQAVTKGLDPTVPMKDSGIPWLGEIPEHWEARKLGSLFLWRGSGTTPNGDAFYGGGIPWVMSGDLPDGTVVSTKRTVTESALTHFSALKLFPKGSLLVAMYGATIGKTGVLGLDACTNQACCSFASPRTCTNPFFIQAAVILARHHLLQLAYGGGQPNINAEVVRSLRVPCPPMSEQFDVLKYLDDEITPIASAITRTEREIALMQEYRTRLTADVVTGKLDVREAAFRVSEELEEAFPMVGNGEEEDGRELEEDFEKVGNEDGGIQ